MAQGFFCGGWKCSRMDCGDVCTTLWIHYTTDLYTLNGRVVCYVNYISVTLVLNPLQPFLVDVGLAEFPDSLSLQVLSHRIPTKMAKGTQSPILHGGSWRTEPQRWTQAHLILSPHIPFYTPWDILNRKQSNINKRQMVYLQQSMYHMCDGEHSFSGW